MKQGIHPEYKEMKIACSSCGTEHEFGTTATKISIDVCSNCHPFYTGNRTSAKATGQVEKFNRRFQKSQDKK
ncbi:50S ribosomal protein L31 [Mycoplasma miroungirhinis]|uniref:Large ribosomal subunit protein bL31 n=1 Tax=Mycoplasma miroungirhinis TaxID=754516 RepID=A0A6M4JAK1_9MOLU|nr:50S ribosomal protein L31 [Mycoplasma miroungirhinis]QJR43930.1 50S ribosomal protein L31 [Mycoplasma miroungirhinis]